MIKINKDDSGKVNYSINLMPKLNIHLVLQIAALMMSWALHESVLRSLVAFIFGLFYIVLWAVFGDSATAEGVQCVVNYWSNIIDKNF